jgi:hypothetical protein
LNVRVCPVSGVGAVVSCVQYAPNTHEFAAVVVRVPVIAPVPPIVCLIAPVWEEAAPLRTTAVIRPPVEGHVPASVSVIVNDACADGQEATHTSEVMTANLDWKANFVHVSGPPELVSVIDVIDEAPVESTFE